MARLSQVDRDILLEHLRQFGKFRFEIHDVWQLLK